MKKCSICLDEMHSHSYRSILKCNHEFHKECLQEWAQYGFECPCCRTPFQEINLNHSLYRDYYDNVEWDDEYDDVIDDIEPNNSNSVNTDNIYIKEADSDLHVVLDIQMRDELNFKNGDIVKVLDVGNSTSSLFVKKYDDWFQFDNNTSDDFLIDYLCVAYGENITTILPQNVLEIVID